MIQDWTAVLLTHLFCMFLHHSEYYILFIYLFIIIIFFIQF